MRSRRGPDLVELAEYHQVESYLAAALAGREDIDLGLVEALLRRQAQQVATNLRILGDLAGLRSLLASSDLEWLLVKGPVLAELMYPHATLRPYQDIDIVVRQGAFSAVIEALEGAGGVVLDRNWDLIRKERRGQLHVVLPMGTVADVHWHLLNRDTVRRTLSVDMESVFARARTMRVSGMDVRTLDPVDTLVHLCVHAALSGGDRLRWLKDVERQILFDRPEWNLVVRRAHEWRAETMVATILRRARTTLGAPVPQPVVDRLVGSRLWRLGAAFVDRAWPPERSTGGVTPLIVWTQASRDSGLAGAQALLRRVGRRAVGAFRHGPGRSPTPASDAAVDVFTPSGGADARSRFLAEVATGRPEGDGGATDRGGGQHPTPAAGARPAPGDDRHPAAGPARERPGTG